MAKKQKTNPRDAATVVLLSDSEPGPYDIFLMKRASSRAYMDGIHVFPGGRLDAADLAEETDACLDGFNGEEALRRLQEGDIPPRLALGLFIAAIRETFEEAGVLFARDSSGKTVDLSAPERAARFTRYRREIYDGRLTLAEMAGREGLLLAPDLLTPYSHWITPEIVSRRFDARFFLARLPEGQQPVHDDIELVDSLWMKPDAALSEQAVGRMVLMQPTLKTIEELSFFSRTEQLFASVAGRRIEPIRPEAFRTQEGLFGVRLPNDPEYSRAKAHTEDWGKATRMIFDGRHWKSLTK